jgi:hypothetical protein
MRRLLSLIAVVALISGVGVAAAEPKKPAKQPERPKAAELKKSGEPERSKAAESKKSGESERSKAAGPKRSAEQPLKFIEALRDGGYGDQAVEYLLLWRDRADMPAELREVWDLEMSKSLKAAAAEAFDQKEYQRLMEQSRRHLEEFIRQNPRHPGLAAATADWGEFLAKQAVEKISAAKYAASKDPAQRDKLLAEARETLLQAKEKYKQSRELSAARLEGVKPASKLPASKGETDSARQARAKLETEQEEILFQAALVDYYLAQTYPEESDPKKPSPRTAALREAAKGFDDVFQRNRRGAAGLTEVGLRAHTWHGKTVEELGDLQLAADIYDEVLVNAAEPNERRPATGLEPLFAEVEYFRMLIDAKRNPERFIAAAAAWLQQNQRRLRATDGYQGVALELAKAILARGEKGTAPEKSKAAAEALKILADMAQVRSRHQQEAILLRRELLAAAGKSDAEVAGLDEAVALADAAAAEGRWAEARELYRRALELGAAKSKDAERLPAVREALSAVELMLARQLFDEGKLSECIETVGEIVFEDAARTVVRKDSPKAAEAAALAVVAALNLYAEASEEKKPAALDKLMNLARFVETNWPDRAEADDARVARGQAKLISGEVREAIDIFERVNPKSDRYPTAMYFAAQNHARLYVVEKSKPPAVRDERQAAEHRQKAIERLRSGLEAIARRAEAADPNAPPPKYQLESQLLLAELYAEGGEMKSAAEAYRPLVEAIEKQSSPQFDQNTIRVYLGAVRAYAALGEFDRAGEAAAGLLRLGPDQPQVNAALVEFARLLDLERKKALAALTELETTTDAAATEAARQRLDSLQKLLRETLVKLAGRKELSPAGMVFVGDALGSLGAAEDARRMYQRFVERVESDAEFARAGGRGMTRVRSQLVGLLAREGNHAEALEQVDKLIKDNPRALEPLMEKGRILNAWAEREPAKYAEAVAHWVALRNRLQSLPNKPPEYYEVVYNVAACLVREAESAKEQTTRLDRAKKAEQVLKAVMVLSPKLDGPDTVARYKLLLSKAIELQGRSPQPAGEKKP